MTEPSITELQDTLKELSAYRDRLRDDVIAMGQKLKLPQKRIDATIAEHPELQRLTVVVEQLEEQIRQHSA
ncbi:hypothetical protein [Synechococcus sp. NOUM97013]|uniref:hypothetical protein n=1 Tax=Synechococcus sp. NOUM97013 TaxID=1442555 RepID=UPI00164798E4|nr:hypothetical protein [Synechococcus sp. NOUM97013]QNI72602.1 hypothetical protein SynNOUM97013_00519 [Synechococcus sp. NOUM97013]